MTLLHALNPRAVAILGASDNPIKAGGRPIDYMRRHGYAGRIFPINPNRSEVQGLPAYASLRALPEAVLPARAPADPEWPRGASAG